MPASTRLRYHVTYDFEDVTVLIASPVYDSPIDHVVVDELVIDFEYLDGSKIINLNDRIKDFLNSWGIRGNNSELMRMKLDINKANLIRVGDNT